MCWDLGVRPYGKGVLSCALSSVSVFQYFLEVTLHRLRHVMRWMTLHEHEQ
jgi:hypothetical protein